jgi:hypothetical protein
MFLFFYRQNFFPPKLPSLSTPVWGGSASRRSEGFWFWLKARFQEESKACFSLSEQVKNRLSEFDEKVERLIDVYINRELSQEEYAKKKAKLLNDKKDLEERLQEIEKSSGGWLEPSKNFVSTCNQAGSVAWQETPSPKKIF